jgi:methanogenic corrinoid protein MtbC1
MNTRPSMERNSSYAERRQQAAAIRALAPSVARQVTDDFFRRYPSWLEKYGLTGVERGVEDARFHVDFLAGAVETGDVDAFAEYLSWAARVLSARNIGHSFLLENVEQVRDALTKQLDANAGDVVKNIVRHAFDVFSPETVSAGSAIDAGAGVYLTAALSGQRTAALNITREAVQEGMSVIDVYSNMLQTAQYEIGRLWETNQISVAQEHLATAVTQYVVSQLYNDLPAPSVRRGDVVVAGVEGELHQLGARILGDALEADGWKVLFLGSQLPMKDVLSFVNQHQPDALALSVTMLFNVPRAAQLIEDVRRYHDGRIRVVVGGSAFRAHRELWRDIGADGAAHDLRGGLALFN